MTMLEDVRPVARQPHRCMACGRTVPPGEKYHRQRWISSDGPVTWKECAHCEVVFAAIVANDHDAVYDDAGLDPGEYLSEYARPDTEDDPDVGPGLFAVFVRRWDGVDVAAVAGLIESCEPLQSEWRYVRAERERRKAAAADERERREKAWLEIRNRNDQYR